MKKLIVANWKCNPLSLAEAKEIFDSITEGMDDLKNTEVVICPPFVYLPELKKDNVRLGAQDCFWEEKGAFTGEISPLQLKDLGCSYVIVGHSERRKYQSESSEDINKKANLALSQGLKTILCIENKSQIKEGIQGISKELLSGLIVAFEPVSAIGTGKAYDVNLARKVNLSIKRELNDIPLLYGGSINAENAKEYIKEALFDGLLVGGVSLKTEEFLKVLHSVDKIDF